MDSRRSYAFAVAGALVFWSLVWWGLSKRDEAKTAARTHKHNAYATRLFLRELEIALETYREERGTVPPCPDQKNGAAVLYDKLLSGERRYLGPRPDRIRHGGSGDEPSVIIDAWGDPIRYRTGGTPPVTANPDYDLWSTGGNPDNPRDRWILPQ